MSSGHADQIPIEAVKELVTLRRRRVQSGLSFNRIPPQAVAHLLKDIGTPLIQDPQIAIVRTLAN